MFTAARIMLCIIFLATLQPVQSNESADTCDEMSVLGLIQQELDKNATNASRDAAKKASESVRRAVTTPNAGVAGFLGSKENFLPLLEVAGLAQSETDDDGNIVVDFNLWKTEPDGPHQAKLRAILTPAPSIYGPLEMAIPESVRSDQSAILNEPLGSDDDFSISFSYNLYTKRLGRLASEAREAFSKLSQQAYESTRSEFFTTANAAFEVLNLLPNRTVGVSLDNLEPCFPLKPLGIDRDVAAAKVKNYLAAEASLAAAEANAINAAQLPLFAKLMDNQPQFSASVTRRERANLVGPDEIKVKLSYEHGFANLNSLRKASGDTYTLSGYQTFITANKAAIEAQHRLSASLEYQDVEDYDVTIPAGPMLDETLNFTMPSSSKLVGKLSYGRALGSIGEKGDGTVIDVSAVYEDPSDNAMARTRAVLSATLTTKRGDFSFPIGLVYANRSEFLGDVDAELSAHFGIKYDLSGLFGE